METINLLLNGVIAAAAAFGAWTAWRGVATWREQLVGQGDYDLAKRLLKGVFETESLIRRMRQVVTADDIHALWNRFDEITSELDIAFLEARVLWGEVLSESKGKLKNCVWDLRRSKYWLEEIERKKSQMSDSKYAELREEHEKVIYTTDFDDDFARQVRNVVQEIEEKLRPHLSP